jgi:hypothetical protein
LLRPLPGWDAVLPEVSFLWQALTVSTCTVKVLIIRAGWKNFQKDKKAAT